MLTILAGLLSKLEIIEAKYLASTRHFVMVVNK